MSTAGRVLSLDEQERAIAQLQSELRAADRVLLKLNKEISEAYVLRMQTNLLLEEAVRAHREAKLAQFQS